MTLIYASQVREAIIDKMQANVSIMALLDDANEVRESNWSGSEFTYPNYRVRINNITPFQDCYQSLDASIVCYSEEASSRQAEEMAGVVANQFHDKAFTQGTIRFTHIVTSPIPAIKVDVRTWRSEVQITSLINIV